MPLIQLIVTIVVIGVIMWLINTYVPMSSSIKKILNIVVAVVVVLFVLNVFGVLGAYPGIRIGR